MFTFENVSDSTSAIVHNIETVHAVKPELARYTDEPKACRECGHSVMDIHFTGCSELD